MATSASGSAFDDMQKTLPADRVFDTFVRETSFGRAGKFLFSGSGITSSLCVALAFTHEASFRRSGQFFIGRLTSARRVRRIYA